MTQPKPIRIRYSIVQRKEPIYKNDKTFTVWLAERPSQERAFSVLRSYWESAYSIALRKQKRRQKKEATEYVQIRINKCIEDLLLHNHDLCAFHPCLSSGVNIKSVRTARHLEIIILEGPYASGYTDHQSRH